MMVIFVAVVVLGVIGIKVQSTRVLAFNKLTEYYKVHGLNIESFKIGLEVLEVHNGRLAWKIHCWGDAGLLLSVTAWVDAFSGEIIEEILGVI